MQTLSEPEELAANLTCKLQPSTLLLNHTLSSDLNESAIRCKNMLAKSQQLSASSAIKDAYFAGLALSKPLEWSYLQRTSFGWVRTSPRSAQATEWSCDCRSMFSN